MTLSHWFEYPQHSKVCCMSEALISTPSSRGTRDLFKQYRAAIPLLVIHHSVVDIGYSYVSLFEYRAFSNSLIPNTIEAFIRSQKQPSLTNSRATVEIALIRCEDIA
jgi:hypothetical protein